MTRATSRELRKDIEGVLRRVAAGELIEITVNGEAVAALSPLTASRPRWTPKATLIESISRSQVDLALADELAELAALGDDLGPLE